MLLLHPSENQDVIQIDYHNAFYYEVSEDVVHYGLEGGQAIGHPKEHYQVFKQTSIGLEGCLPLVSRLNADIVETPIDIIINLIVSRCSTYELFLCFILLHISNSSVSTSLVGHVLYSVDLMSAICSPRYYLMVHRYIYSRYSSVFLMLYQLYHFLPSSTLNSSSSLYLGVAT